MRTVAKYKFLKKQLLDRAPVRILKFKRSRWVKSKKLIQKINTLSKKKSKIKLKTIAGVFVSNRALPKIKSYYSERIATKITFKQLFDLRGKITTIRNHPLDFDVVLNRILVKQYFKPEILLYKLNFFSSISEAVQFLSTGKVLINLQIKKPNFFLKGGDIITFNCSSFDNFFKKKKIITNQIFLKKSLFSFLEVDFLTKTIIILKDSSDISSKDYNLFLSTYLNIQHLKDFN